MRQRFAGTAEFSAYSLPRANLPPYHLGIPYLLFLLAILTAARFGGFWPASLATIASALAAMYFFLPPAGFAIAGPADWVALVLFVVAGHGIAWLSQRGRNEAAHRDRALAGSRLEEQLRSSEARWRSIINSAVDGIVVIDQSGRVEAFNPAAERLVGYSEDEMLGRNVNVLMPSPYHEEHDGYVSRYLATGQARIIGIGREVIGRRRDGTTFPLHLSVGQFMFEGRPKFTGILHDLTARVAMEEHLRERTSLARLGEMAAVIAHEVRNPLAGIRGASTCSA